MVNKDDNDKHPYNDLPENANEKDIPDEYSLKRYLPDSMIKNLQETYVGIIPGRYYQLSIREGLKKVWKLSQRGGGQTLSTLKCNVIFF